MKTSLLGPANWKTADFSLILPAPEAKKEIELEPDFLMDQLLKRIPVPAKKKAGIDLPEPAPLQRTYWDAHAYSSMPRRAPRSIICDDIIQGESDKSKEFDITYVRMGSPKPLDVRKYARTPDLPPQTRKCYMTPKRENKTEEYVSWKYFGDTDNICGCYTAKIPLKMKEQVGTRRINHLPNGRNKLKKIQNRPKTATSKARSYTPNNLDLFQRSIKRPPPKPDLREIIRTNEELSEFDEYLDEQTESFIEYKGKMIPLKKSCLARYNLY